MSVRKSFFLDRDEQHVISNMFTARETKERVIKYASLHGYVLQGKSFEYDPETGEVVWFESDGEK